MRKIIESVNLISFLLCVSAIDSSYIFGIIAIINIFIIKLLEEGAGKCQRNIIG